jgi:hypothetical protein
MNVFSFLNRDPVQSASPRDLAVLLESMSQRLSETADQLDVTDECEWRDDVALELLADAESLARYASAFRSGVQAVRARRRRMEPTLAAIHALPETGDGHA